CARTVVRAMDYW
nr:immunoglobulin heavy chain junction region [Mus musculus]